MKKISELIKYYESFKCDSDFEAYFSDPNADNKIYILKLMMEAIGDVSLPEEYFKAFMYCFCKYTIDEPYERTIEKIQILYELCKDVEMTIDDLICLIACYRPGPYKLLFDELKELMRTGKLSGQIYLFCEKAYDIARDEAAKLDYLKEEYGKSFIEDIQRIVVEYCLTADEVIKILPSKALIDSSEVRIPGLHYSILSGEDIVTRRLRYLGVERSYQKTPLDQPIKLGICSHGDTIFTSFTKREYEEDLKSEKKLIKKR